MKSPLRGKVTIIEPYLEGHRGDQLAAMRSLLLAHNLHVDHQIRLWPHIFTRNPLLFPSVDGSFLAFLLIAPIRTLLLRRTVAIWHRPKASTNGRGIKRYAKYYGAKLVKSVPLVALISVQKPQLQPEISTLFTDWIHQIAQWYKPLIASEYSDDSKSFTEAIQQHANGRAIIIYLGEIAPEKGFEFFCDLLVESTINCTNFAFVAAGKVSPRNAYAAHRFMKGGGLLVDRYLSDGEFLMGIDVADWVWICYRPDHDQNSGIFGLAYQAGAKVIVRNGSFVDCLAKDLEFPTVRIEYGNAKQALATILASQKLTIERPKDESINLMKERTCERLLCYLGYSTVLVG
jgi:hypothetical protein